MSKTNRIPTRQPDFLPFQIVDGNKKRSNVSIFNVPLGQSLPGADLEYQWSKTDEKVKPLTEETLKDLNLDPRLLPKSATELLKELKPLEFLIQNLIVRSMVYTLTARNNHGKTTLAMAMAAAVTMGSSFASYKAKPGRVLWLSGENTMDTLYKIKLLEEKGLIDSDRIHIIDHSFDLKELTPQLICAMNLVDSLNLHDQFDLVVIDSLQAYAGGMDLNGNSAALTYLQEIRRLTQQGAAVLILAHPIKSATKDNLVPYGGGSIMNEIDANFELWLDDDLATLELGKRRQLQIPTISLKLEVLETTLKDADNNKTQTTMFRSLDSAQAETMQQEKDAQMIKLFELLDMTDQPISNRHLADKIFPGDLGGLGKVQRLIRKARQRKFMHEDGAAKLTKAGEDYLRK